MGVEHSSLNKHSHWRLSDLDMCEPCPRPTREGNTIPEARKPDFQHGIQRGVILPEWQPEFQGRFASTHETADMPEVDYYKLDSVFDIIQRKYGDHSPHSMETSTPINEASSVTRQVENQAGILRQVHNQSPKGCIVDYKDLSLVSGLAIAPKSIDAQANGEGWRRRRRSSVKDMIAHFEREASTNCQVTSSPVECVRRASGRRGSAGGMPIRHTLT
jgi:hypothetical protein